MNVHVIILAYILSDEVDTLLRELNGPDVTYHLFLHSHNYLVESVCNRWGEEPNVRYYHYGINRGLGKSVNEGILSALASHADAIVIPNDDVTMNRADLDKLVQGCIEHKDAGLIFCNDVDGQSLAFHVFGINKLAFDVVGCFDESFPDYFCDTDYLRRCALLGVKIHNIGNTGIVHVGSTTIRAVPELQMMYPAHEAHYRKKHGGSSGNETFVFPFNDPTYSWKILAEDRSNPYLTHQRTDMPYSSSGAVCD